MGMQVKWDVVSLNQSWSALTQFLSFLFEM